MRRIATALLTAALAIPVSAAPDPVAEMLRSVKSKNIERTIKTLVSFGTRNTLSSQDDPKRGIGAARDWLYGEFKKAAETSGGRMTVELQSFDQEAGKFARIAKTTKLTNVIATLHGTQPESEKRVYVVSGHYDSMCSSPTDADCDAPGANDDASGTAAVLEAARVMAPHAFDATIVFMAVAGEEQGLVGSTHFAEVAKQQGMDIDATPMAAMASSIARRSAFSRKACRATRRKKKRGCAGASAARTTRHPASSRASSSRRRVASCRTLTFT
jgi:hypothetical protein